MNNLSEVFDSVSNWNSLRYDRVINTDLLVSMLNEELDEYYEGDSAVDKLDAICDITYVAMGGLWKLEAPEEINEAYFEQTKEMIPNILNAGPYGPMTYIRGYIDSIKYSAEVPVAFSLHMIIQSCFYEMLENGLSSELAYQALGAVCKSNNTKSIKKVDPSDKGYGPKGEFYVSPTAELTKILEKSHVNRH